MIDQRVLIVDDEQRTLMFLRESLVVAGLNADFTCASSAQEALKAFAQHHFSIVILDVRLADMNGLDLLRRLRELDAGVPVIMVSAYSDAGVEAAARSLGAHSFFRKPFGFDEFTNAVASALRESAKGANGGRSALGWDAQFVHRQLTALLRDTGAQSVLLINRQGAIIARVGEAAPLSEIVAAPAGNQTSVFNFAYYQGKTHDIYSADVRHGISLSLVFDRNQPSSRIGLVLQYTRRAVQELASNLEAARPLQTAVQPA
jgi:DNA-binding response OmpR family regulator